MTDDLTRCGTVAVVGLPNVGKSTLVNRLVGEKVTITGPRPHTTRHAVRGVLNKDRVQIIFQDTPGLAKHSSNALQRIMQSSVQAALDDADLVVAMFSATGLSSEDRNWLEPLADSPRPVIAVLNKIDRIKAKQDLLPVLGELSTWRDFAALVPCSAETGVNMEGVVDEICKQLPEGPWLFPVGQATDAGTVFRIGEVIREKLMPRLHAEVPYGLMVEIERMQETAGRWLVHAVIWVEREQHKAIVIGKGGKVLKAVGTSARPEIQKLLGGHVNLQLWVKVRESWSADENVLKRLGFEVS
jgi:GTP-binding protein Era